METVIGGVMALLGVLLGVWLSSRADHRQWQRELRLSTDEMISDTNAMIWNTDDYQGLIVHLEKVRARLRRFEVSPEKMDQFENAAKACWQQAYASLQSPSFDPEIGPYMSMEHTADFREAYEALWQDAEPRMTR